jgi:hypothetical protein
MHAILCDAAAHGTVGDRNRYRGFLDASCRRKSGGPEFFRVVEIGFVNPARHSDAFAIEALYPSFHLAAGVSYSVKSVMEGIAYDKVKVGATVVAKSPNVHGSYVHPLMSTYLYRFLNPHIKSPMHWVFRSARHRLHAGDIAYLM